MADVAMIRTPKVTPAQPSAGVGLFPPPLDEDGAVGMAEWGDGMPRQATGSGGMSAYQLGSPVSDRPVEKDLLLPPPLGTAASGAAAIDQSSSVATTPFRHRQYRSHSPTAMGRILDFVGVPTHLTMGGMLAALLRLCIPATTTTILYFSNQAVTMMFVGRQLGTNHLAMYSVGLSVFNMCGLSIGLGLATGLDTLCSQAYGRDSNTPELGELLQRGAVVCLSVAVPIIALFFAIEPLLVVIFGPLLGPGVAFVLRCTPPYLIGVILMYCVQKTLQAQQLADLPVIANVASAVSCPLFNYFLTAHGVGYAVLAIALSVWVCFAVMVVGIVWHPKSIIRLSPWTKAITWVGLKEFLHVGFPGMLGIVSEWWSFEVIIAIAARQGAEIVTAFTICTNVVTFMFAIPSGLAVATGVLCGNFLGANDPKGARAFGRVAIALGIVLFIAADVVLLLFGDMVFRQYTHDKHVLHLVESVKPLLALFHAGDALASVVMGIYRGVGQQASAARLSVASLWLVGLPATWYLAQSSAPLEGIWIGMIAGFAVEGPLLCYNMLQWDWLALAERATRAAQTTTKADSLSCSIKGQGGSTDNVPPTIPSYGAAS